MCDIYPMEMCMEGYDIDGDIYDGTPTDKYYWDDVSCKYTGYWFVDENGSSISRRGLNQVDARRKVLALAHSA